MADDGGSTGELRDVMGVLPPGDVRQCLVALSNSEHLREVFTYRFAEGPFSGHSLGNVLLSGIEEMAGGDFKRAVETVSDILSISGRVVPVTLDDRRLVVTTGDGRVIKGESNLDNDPVLNLKGCRVEYDQPAMINDDAARAIETADMVVIAPGDLYTSIAPVLAVRGVGHALQATRAKRVYVCNLVNKERHTRGFSVEDYVEEIDRLSGYPIIDYVLYNHGQPSPEALRRYVEDKEFPVEYDETSLSQQPYKAISGDFVAPRLATPTRNDKIHDRSLIRHDGARVARALMRLYFSD